MTLVVLIGRFSIPIFDQTNYSWIITSLFLIAFFDM